MAHSLILALNVNFVDKKFQLHAKTCVRLATASINISGPNRPGKFILNNVSFTLTCFKYRIERLNSFVLFLLIIMTFLNFVLNISPEKANWKCFTFEEQTLNSLNL